MSTKIKSLKLDIGQLMSLPLMSKTAILSLAAASATIKVGSLLFKMFMTQAIQLFSHYKDLMLIWLTLVNEYSTYNRMEIFSL